MVGVEDETDGQTVTAIVVVASDDLAVENLLAWVEQSDHVADVERPGSPTGSTPTTGPQRHHQPAVHG